jgi:hypothetical protein
MWVFEKKLLGVLYLIAKDWDANFTQEEYDSIRHELFHTNSEENRFIDFTFQSYKGDLTIKLGREQETDIIIIEPRTENKEVNALLRRIDLVQECFSSWTLDDPNFIEVDN